VTLLPPTRAGWQRFLDLAPKSGESYSTLKEIGLSWWGRKIPQNLLAEAADEVDEAPPSTSVSRTTSPRIQETTVSRSEVFAPTGDVPPIPPPSRSVATPPPSRPDKPYDEARAALKALGLVPKKYAYYLRQAETAIESGKSYLPIVSRARKTAEKDKVDASRASNRASAAPRAASRPRRSLVDAALETFNAEPGWRLALVRGRPSGYVLAVYPEGRTQDEAVASIDVIDANIDEIRWLDDRIAAADQDAIVERIERALWAAYDADEERDDDVPIPSPLQDLIDMMERRSNTLGARPAASENPARTDGYRQIAEALRDLSQPSGMTAEELQRWLESEDLMDAGEVVGQAASAEPAPVRTLMRDLWDSIVGAHPLEEVSGKPGDLRVPGEALFGTKGNEFVLKRVREGDRAALRRIRVRRVEYDEDSRTYAIEEPTDRLAPGAEVHRNDRDERFFAELYQKIGAFEDDLVRAPKTLQDVRTLLYWTAVMLDAPLCQGDVKRRATRAFEQAKVFHDTARQRLVEGRSADAVRRLQAALRRISTAAAEIARSCGEGQITLEVAPAELSVRPEDAAVIESGGDVASEEASA
jgi:hypothetical protein